MVGEVRPEVRHCLQGDQGMPGFDAIEQAVAGNRIGDIGHAVQQHAEAHQVMEWSGSWWDTVLGKEPSRAAGSAKLRASGKRTQTRGRAWFWPSSP